MEDANEIKMDFNSDGSLKKRRVISEQVKQKRLRNLIQYKDMPENEFQEVIDRRNVKIETSEDFETRIKEKLAEFENDYDLSDLKINDKETLRALVQSIIALEDYEQLLFTLRTSEGQINANNIYLFEKINKVCSDLRADMSHFQDDLKITRKTRKSDQETSFVAYLEGLKEKARKFMESRMMYIFCNKCNTLLATSISRG
jgi:hypothetical protein